MSYASLLGRISAVRRTAYISYRPHGTDIQLNEQQYFRLCRPLLLETMKNREVPIDEKQPVAEPQNDGGDGQIIDFDGPDDPSDPLNWSPMYKWSIVIIISLLSLEALGKTLRRLGCT